MRAMKPGKWVGHHFNDAQKNARATWNRASKQKVLITDALYICDWRSRAELHKRLDQRLDEIERLQAKALKLFPDVDESFTVASQLIQFEPKA